MVLAKIIDWLHGKAEPEAIPDALWQQTLADLPFLDRLSEAEKAKLRRLSEAFLADKEFTSAGGLELTDAMRVSIAAQGCLLVLNLDLSYYRDWVGIVVYPDEFVIPRTIEDEFGIVHEYDDVASGEAWAGGPLLISWRDVEMAGEGYNVVIHEFAHKLDMRNGEADGMPPLPADLPRQEWEHTLLAAYDDFCAQVDACEIDEASGEEHGEAALQGLCIDPYAAENPAEFFAVLSETFFEMPAILDEDYPALYALFCRFYRQDPLTAACPDSSNPVGQAPA